MTHIVYLTRRNLETLLSKLNRVKAGQYTTCTIIKNDTTHKKYPCSAQTQIMAIENDDYYTERQPGYVHPLDEPLKGIDKSAIKLIGMAEQKNSARRALENKLPILFYGFTGNGKTLLAKEIAEEYAKAHDIPVIYQQLYPEMTKNSLIGGETLENGSIIIKTQPIINFGQKGAVFIIDEATHTTEPVLLAFNSLIEDPFSTIIGHEVVKMHEKTRFIFCGNLPDHTGNIALPTSFANRLFIIKTDLLSSDELVQIGLAVNDSIPEAILKFIAGIIQDTHDASFPVSPRNMVSFCMNYPGIRGTGGKVDLLPAKLKDACYKENIDPGALKNSIMSSLMGHVVFKTDGPKKVEALLW